MRSDMRLDYVDKVDCLVGMKEIPDGSVQMVLVDLPYATTRNPWDSAIPLDKLWAEWERILVPNGCVVLTCQIPFTLTLMNSKPDWLRYEWIWVKNKATGFLNAQRMPLKTHEQVLVFYKSLPKFNPQGIYATAKPQPPGSQSDNYGECMKFRENPNNYGDFMDGVCSGYTNYPKDILEFSMDQDSFHPTQKPVKLFEYLIRTYTDEGDVVLDCCMGSGTTAVAAIRTGRHYIGFELNDEYFGKLIERIAQTKRVDEGVKTLDSFFRGDHHGLGWEPRKHTQDAGEGRRPDERDDIRG